MIFSESPAAPGVPLVYRTPEDRASNPDRLNLDRYGQVVPMVKSHTEHI